MPSIRRCPTCKVLFPTIDALNDHYKLTSHIPLDYNCETCKRAFKTLSGLQNHIKSNRRSNSKLNCRTPARIVVKYPDGRIWNGPRDDENPGTKNDINGLNSPESNDRDAQCGLDNPGNVGECDSAKDGRDPTLVEKRPSAALNNISKPPFAISEPTLPAAPPLNWYTRPGPSLSTMDAAFSRALSISRLQDERLNVSNLHEATSPFNSNARDAWKAGPPVSKLDGYGSCSITTDLPLNRTNESKLPLNSPDNTAYLFTCPGCRKDFKLFSGFVLHIENRSCNSSMCHEIEDRINKCAMQLFDTFACGRI